MTLHKSSSKYARWKMIIMTVITFIFLLRIGFIAIRGEIEKEYFTSAKYNLSEATTIPCQDVSQTFLAPRIRLNSLELYFTNIADDKAGAITLRITQDSDLIYQTNISLANLKNSEWKKVFVNADLIAKREYRIHLTANEKCSQIPNVLVVNHGYSPEIQASYFEGNPIEGNIAINFGYLRFPSLFDQIVAISIWILLYIIIYLFLVNVESIILVIKKPFTLLTSMYSLTVSVLACELVATLLIINCSGIQFQEMTKVVIFGIAIFSSLLYVKQRKIVKNSIDKHWKKILLTLLYLYGSFSLVGQRLLIYPLTLNVSVEGIFIFLSTAFWFVPIINALIIILHHLSNKDATNRMKTWKFIAAIFVFLLLPAILNLIANNPGISSPDTFNSMITNAQHIHGMYDWHPAFYCMVLRVIENVWNSTYAVIFVQYFFWVYVLTELFLFLRKKGLSDSVILIASFLCGINAGNFIHINTIWKDIPYTLSLIWAFILTAKLTINYEEYKKKWYIYLELIISLIGVFFYRKNGIISYAVIAIVLLFVLIKNWKAIISLVLSFALILIIKGPVYSYYQVEDPGYRGMYHGLGLDILGVYYSAGEVSESTLKMINMMTAYNNAEYSYNPTWSSQSYDVNVPPKEFIKNYINTFVKNPLTMTRAIIAREDALWDVFAGKDTTLGCVNYTGTEDHVSGWNTYYNKREYTSIRSRMSMATAYTSNSQWLAAIEWRSGLSTLISLIISIWLIIRKGKGRYLAILAAPIGHIFSLLLSTGWSDFRYFWPINLLSFSLVLLSLILIKERASKDASKERNSHE